MSQPDSSASRPGNVDSPQPHEDFRTLARRLALQMLHQLSVQNGANLEQIEPFLAEYGRDPACRDLAQKWIKGAWQNLEAIDRTISAVSTNWDLARISQVDRSNLRLAVFQLRYCPEIPPKVVINEAVELAKQFSTAQAPGFVNGVLDAIRERTDKEANS